VRIYSPIGEKQAIVENWRFKDAQCFHR